MIRRPFDRGARCFRQAVATEGGCTFRIQAEAATTTAPPISQFAISGWMKASPTITTRAIAMLMPTVQKREVEIGATGEGEDS
jgi:hypothetical protein